MSHIAEGLLHAHLDGALGPDDQAAWTEAAAHLEVCGDCRRRLEEAREVREVAGTLLSEASVASVARPAFEDIVAAAEGRRRAGGSLDAEARALNGSPGRPDRARPAVPWWSSPMRLAWAASLVLAVGAGWIGRELMIEQGETPPHLTADSDLAEGNRVATSSAAETQGLASPGADETDPLLEESARPSAAAEEDRGAEEDRVTAPARRLEREALADAEAPPEALARERAAPDARDEAVEAREDARNVGEGAGLDERARADEPPRAGEPAVQGFAAKVEGTACFVAHAVPAEAADRRGLRQADGGQRDLDQGGMDQGGIDFPGVLRLEPNGTAGLDTQGRPLVGFWTVAGPASRNVRVTDGATWYELRIEETEAGWRANVMASTGPGDAPVATDRVGRTVRLDREECP